MLVYTILYYLLLQSLAFSQNINETLPEKGELVILSYNVRNCNGMDNTIDYQRVTDIITRIDPDLVALQELDSATQRSKGAVVLIELATRTGMYSVYGPSIDFQWGKYGIGILSKKKPISSKFISMPGIEEKRGLLIAEFDEYIFCCTHLSLTEKDRLESVKIINALFAKSAKPVFLAGDINSIPESEVVKNIETRWMMLNNPASPTIPSPNPTKCIDFIFALKNNGHEIKALQSVVEKEPLASDHLPVWVRVTYSNKYF
jgi:endonuclease/exonuclease/phosphatase family metal-dependent hydrolase